MRRRTGADSSKQRSSCCAAFRNLSDFFYFHSVAPGLTDLSLSPRFFANSCVRVSPIRGTQKPWNIPAPYVVNLVGAFLISPVGQHTLYPHHHPSAHTAPHQSLWSWHCQGNQNNNLRIIYCNGSLFFAHWHRWKKNKCVYLKELAAEILFGVIH